MHIIMYLFIFYYVHDEIYICHLQANSYKIYIHTKIYLLRRILHNMNFLFPPKKFNVISYHIYISKSLDCIHIC